MLLRLLLLGFLLAPNEIDVPENDGWVTDLADLLKPDEEGALEALMESYRAGTSHEIALLTIPSLAGEPIERYALEVARAWRIGGQEANDGALLVVARDDRELRIEVGRGLEGTLTDSIAGRILRDVITPAFRRGDFYGGIRAGLEAMHAAIGGDYGPIERTAEGRRDEGGRIAIGGVLFLLILLSVLGAARRASRHGRKDSGLSGWLVLSTLLGQHGRRSGGLGGFGRGGGGGGGGGFSGGGASGGW